METPKQEWRKQWLRYGYTPYYYFYPNQLGNGNHLRQSQYVDAFGWISLFLWIFLLFSVVSWWWWDWMLIVWPILLGLIIIEWGVGYGGLLYVEREAYEDAKRNEDPNTNDMRPTKIKTTTQLKSLKMQL